MIKDFYNWCFLYNSILKLVFMLLNFLEFLGSWFLMFFDSMKIFFK